MGNHRRMASTPSPLSSSSGFNCTGATMCGPSFRPGMAIIIGVLTTIFSLTFLLLLYARHCRRANYGNRNNAHDRNNTTGREPRNSGVDRSVVESLPLFRFGALQGEKEGLECAVCLSRFDSTELLRLLPKCKHGFHVECVDTWLDAHSTCPLCRCHVQPEDILLVSDIQVKTQQLPIEEEKPSSDHNPAVVSTGCGFAIGNRRVSGRHSSAGERSTTNSSSSSSSQSIIPISKWRKSVGDRIVKPVTSPASVPVPVPVVKRKDLLLLTEEMVEKRFGHRIVLSNDSDGIAGNSERWSDLRPSDLFILKTDQMMVMGEGGIHVCSFRASCSSGGNKGIRNARRRAAEERTLRRLMSWVPPRVPRNEHDIISQK